MDRLYRGTRGPETNALYVDVIYQDGVAGPLHHVKHHSPTGFECGYHGSGPADLALSILCDAVNEMPTPDDIYQGKFRAAPYYQRFKRSVVSMLPSDTTWVIPGFLVDAMIDWYETVGKTEEGEVVEPPRTYRLALEEASEEIGSES